MRNFDEATITVAVLQRVRAAKDDRIRQVSDALVRHLHAFVREIEPTQAEWEAGIDFLTRTGQMCETSVGIHPAVRYAGVSMPVDAINHRTPEGALRRPCSTILRGCASSIRWARISPALWNAPLLVTGTYRRLRQPLAPALWWTSTQIMMAHMRAAAR